MYPSGMQVLQVGFVQRRMWEENVQRQGLLLFTKSSYCSCWFGKYRHNLVAPSFSVLYLTDLKAQGYKINGMITFRKYST